MDIELVIKMDEEEYNIIKRAHDNYLLPIEKLIKKGIPLPKGHGRLIDADYKVSSDGRTVNSVCGYMAPTIIEADTESEDQS